MRTEEDGEGQRRKKKDVKMSFNEEHVKSAFTK